VKGFFVGSLALIAFYALVQPNAASSTQTASNVFVAGLRRALSADVAGIGNHGFKRLGKKVN